RALYMTAVLLVALGAGAGLAVVLNQVFPVFLSRGMLAAVTGLPVLGSISYVRTRAPVHVLRRDPVLIGVCGGALFAIYLIGLSLADSASRIVGLLTG